MTTPPAAGPASNAGIDASVDLGHGLVGTGTGTGRSPVPRTLTFPALPASIRKEGPHECDPYGETCAHALSDHVQGGIDAEATIIVDVGL